MIGRNIVANAIGGSWFAILSLLIIPVQIRILGVDAYGLLAFSASLQIIFSIFDFGLSPTITRVVATDTSPDLVQSRELIQTLTTGYGIVGLLLGGALIGSADWLVNHWLNLGTLPVGSARAALQLAGVAVMLRWPVSFLSGVLIGRGRFTTLNVLKTGVATFGVLGGAVVILVYGDLVAFAAWTALSALVEVTIYLIACFRVVPDLTLRPRISRQAVGDIWRFARDMSVISVLAIVLTQSDRLLLSKLVPIEVLGYYSLAYNVLFGMTLLQNFVTSALFPAFAADHDRGAQEHLVSIYSSATQGLVYVFTLPIAALVFFGDDLLSVWTSDETAALAGRILSVLALGFLLNAPLAIASTLAVATGNTEIVVRVNVIAIVVYLPVLFLAIERWGGVGAAACWFLLNVYYLFSLLPLVQQRIVRRSAMDWIVHILLPYLAAGGLTFGAARVVLTITGWHREIAIWAVIATATLAYVLWGLRLLNPALRRELLAVVRRPTVVLRRAS